VTGQTLGRYREEKFMQQTPKTATAPPLIAKPIAQVGNGQPRPNPAPYYALRTLRWTVSLLLLTVPLAYLAYFLIGGGIIRSELVQGTFAFRYTEAIVGASLALANKLFAFRPVVEGWNFMLLGLTVVALLLRQIVMLPVDRAEQWARTKYAPSKKAESSGQESAAIFSAEERGATHRLNKLREYAQAKQYLYEEKAHLAFLSIDVVGSTKMKLGEDKLAIEHAFAEYKKFVERILKQNNIWKVAWTPDGIMCAFITVNNAVKAAQDVLSGLPWFNTGVHHLKTPFNVRCGINAGEVIFPPEKAMEEISDEVIDVAGHMQKYAAHGALWLPQQLLEELPDRTGFRVITAQQVDGHTPYEWRADDLGDSAPRGASTPADH
jgi:class 3 adenylate cyclase